MCRRYLSLAFAVLCFAAAAGRVTASAAVRRGLIDAELVDATTDAAEGEADTRVAADSADASDAVDAAVGAADTTRSDVKRTAARQNALAAADTSEALRARLTRRQRRWGGNAGGAGSDGSIHWLRENARGRHGFNPLRVLVASTAGGFPGGGAVNGYNLDPPAALLTAQQAFAWATAPANTQAFLVQANAKAYFAGVAVGTYGNVAPLLFASLANCHPSVIGALAGLTGTAFAADARLGGWAGGIVCDTRDVNGNQRDYAFVRSIVDADAAMRAYTYGGYALNANAITDLAAAYPFIVGAGLAALDWTYFDGWWYGTAHGGVGAGGYRLERAFGPVVHYGSAVGRQPTAVDRQYVRRDDNFPGGAPVFGKHAVAAGPPPLVADDAGHVRANEFGGEREPINFVPESPATNQVLFRKCENTARWAAVECAGQATIRMAITYTYAGAAALRPNFVRTRITVEGGHCDTAAHGRLAQNTILMDANIPNT